MKKRLLIFILLFFPLFHINANNNQKIISLDENIYNYIDVLFSLENMNQPSNTRPWSINETQFLLNRIDLDKLNKTEKTLYNKIIKDFNRIKNVSQFDKNVNISFGLEVKPQLYLHTNEDYDLDDKWINSNAEDRSPLLNMDVNISYKDNFFYYMSLEYGTSRYFPLLNGENELDYYNTNGSNDLGTSIVLLDGVDDSDIVVYYPKYDPYYSKIFATNISDKYRDTRLQGPFRNYISFGDDGFSFTFSKDKLNLGQSIVGNMVVDKHVDHFDYTNLSVFSDKFKFSWMNLFFDTQQTHLQLDLYDGFKILMLAKFEFNVTNNFTFNIMQGMMYHGDNFDISYLNPSYYFHSLNNREIFNSIASLNAIYNINSGLKTYFQFVVDQLKLPNELESQEPSAIGALLGLSQIIDLNNKILDIQAEVGFTSPQMYKRDYVDFIMYNKYYTNGNISNSDDLYYVFDFDYIGFPYGGDSLYGKIQANYYSLKDFNGELSYLLLLRGPTAMFSAFPTAADTTIFPISFEKIYNIINFKGSYEIEQKYFNKANLDFAIALVNTFDTNLNQNKFDAQFNLGLTIKL
ncbi:MAG: hypothetical protein ACPKOI_00995 [Pleomorphochaeta sp.]